MEYKDYYKILGVDKNSSNKEIKAAYRKLAKKYHPDVNQGDEKSQEKFKEISEAYEVLSDPDKKQKYDTFGSNYDFANGYNFDPNQYGYTYTTSSNTGDFSDFFDMFFGGSGSAGGSSSRTGGFNLGDILGDFGKRTRRKERQSFNSELSISIKEAYEGVDRTVSLSYDGRNFDVLVKIPAGITPGKKVKVKGEKFGIEGDILFKINILDGPNLKLEGLNIIKTVDVMPWQVALGDKVTVATPVDKIKLNVPKGVKGGTKMRVPKKGFKDMKGDVGDLFVLFNIVVPKDLTPEEEELYEKLKELRK